MSKLNPTKYNIYDEEHDKYKKIKKRKKKKKQRKMKQSEYRKNARKKKI